MQVAVDDTHNKVIWPLLSTDDNRFWLLFYAEQGQHKIVITEAERVIQEDYVDPAKPEDLLSVFTSTMAATLFVGAIGREVGAEVNDNFRLVSMSRDRFLAFLKDLDKVYVDRQNAWLRVDICEIRHGELRREILFSRQVPKH